MKLKVFLILLFFRISLISFSQNYAAIPFGHDLYFIDSEKYVFPIVPDSVKFINGDTIYFHYKFPREYFSMNIQSGKYNMYADSWFGGKTVCNALKNIFITLGNDSIVVSKTLTINGINISSKK